MRACFDEQWTKKEAVDSAAGTPGSDDRNVFQGFSFTAPSLMLEADVALAHAAVREKRAEMERMIREESLSEDGTRRGRTIRRKLRTTATTIRRTPSTPRRDASRGCPSSEATETVEEAGEGRKWRESRAVRAQGVSARVRPAKMSARRSA